MRILALNTGSSSLKFAWAEMRGGAGVRGCTPTFRGVITDIGAIGRLRWRTPEKKEEYRNVADHAEAVNWVFDVLGGVDVDAVGHRIVHGGSRFTEPVFVEPAVLGEIETLARLAPQHNPLAAQAIRAAQSRLGSSRPMIALFDTAFHAGMPETAALYALPRGLAERHGIRRYGFHGLAHASMARQYADTSSGRAARLITVHLGHGCSMAAIRDGRSVDTSMGFTPLEGLVMGTRSGDVDPSVIGYLTAREGWDVGHVERLLNERSGLLGLSELSGDMGELLAACERGHKGATLAVEMFCYRAKKYLGAYLAAVGGADAVVFGGGIGERAPTVRARICEGMQWCGIELDDELNRAAVSVSAGDVAMISTAGTVPAVAVAGVDEEAEIIHATDAFLRGQRAGQG